MRSTSPRPRHRPDAVTHPIKRDFVDLQVDEPVPGSLAAARLDAWERGRTSAISFQPVASMVSLMILGVALT